MEDLKPTLKKLMKRVTTPVRICINDVWSKYKPQTIEQLLYLVDKCISDKTGVSDSVHMKQKAELNSLISELEEELKEMEKIKDIGRELEEKSKKIPPKTPPRRPE